VLPHVIDVDAAMQPDAPLLFEDMITRGIEPPPAKPSNISKRIEFRMGDIDAGFAAADEIVETAFRTAPVHQGYIEPQACLARSIPTGRQSSGVEPGALRRAHPRAAPRHQDRDLLHAAERRRLRRTVVYVEPVAVTFPQPGHPVKRDEPGGSVQGNRPTSGLR
jgi:hypothetical protein